MNRKGYIALAFLTQEIGGEKIDVSASQIQHLISLDAATGGVVASRTWPAVDADFDNVYVGATVQGDFTLLIHGSRGDALCLFSPDLREIRRMDLPADPATSTSDWSILVPPGGASVFLQHYLNGTFSLQMLDATTLSELRAWSKSEDIKSVSGQYLLRLPRDSLKNVTLSTRALDTPWRIIASLGACFDADAEFINKDTLSVASCDTAKLISADGRVIYIARAPKRRRVGSVWGSMDGRFLAVATTTKHGLGIAEAFDMSSGPTPRRLLIYDTKMGNLVDSLKFTWGYELAYLPDSSGFVLLSGGILEMFSLPQMAP